MIKYLGGFFTDDEKKEIGLVIPKKDEYDFHPIFNPPKYEPECQSLLKEFLNDDIIVQIKDKISQYGTNLNNIIKINEVCPKNNIGILLADASCLEKFGPLYEPIIYKAHNLDKDKVKNNYLTNFIINNLALNDIKKIEISKIKEINNITLSISRNLHKSPFVLFSCIEDRAENILNNLNNNKLFQNKDSNFIPKESNFLDEINYDKEFLNGVTPNNLNQKSRKIYHDEKNNLTILINHCDNLQILKKIEMNKIRKNEDFIKNFNDFIDFYRKIDYNFGFESNNSFGYLLSNIAIIGYGFSITTEIDLGFEDEINKAKEYFEKLDKYTDWFKIKKNEKSIYIIFSSSPKISEKSFPQFLIEYFEKINKFLELQNSF
jgi:hypothetical protein